MKFRALFRIPYLLLLLAVLGGGCVSAAQLLFTPWTKTDIPGAANDLLPSDCGALNLFRGGDENGQRVIFVHGTPGGADNWASFVQNPLPHTESVAYDRPGFGRTRPVRAMPDIVDQAAALEPLLIERNGAWPILVGHSLGGPIVCQVAADFPDRVGGIVIVAGSLDPALEVVYLVQHLGNTLALRWIVPRVLRNANAELIDLEAGLEALQPRLKDIACPIVIIHGTRDRLVPFENVAYMESQFNGKYLRQSIILQDDDHFLPWTAPDAIRGGIELLLANPPAPKPSTMKN